MKQKIITLLTELNRGLVERDSALKLGLLAVLASENMLLIGPPGTAKSLIARRLAESVLEGNGTSAEGYFEYLLTKFSTPEEIFGPLSISELKADRFKRNTDGYLPTAKVAFLDEIFKASSSILNALLTILNERIYHNGRERQSVPLHAIIAASNELPTGQEELDALYDRFLLRSFVGYVSERALGDFFEPRALLSLSNRFDAADLQAIPKAAEKITIPQDVRNAIQSIWLRHREEFKEDQRERLSDRRLTKIIGLLRISALTNERSEVDLSDVVLLKDCLWNHPDNAAKVNAIIMNRLQEHNRRAPHSPEHGAHLIAPPTRQTAQANAKVKGYAGSGTAEDPLLIGNIDELQGLHRPDVGQLGYYFRQTADIDCSKLSSWDAIRFNGRYNGAGFVIHGPSGKALFSTILPSARVRDLNLKGFSLAILIQGAMLLTCSTDNILIRGEASDSEISGCNSGSHLITGDVEMCTIARCRAGGFLIDNWKNGGSTALRCNISDCLVICDCLVDRSDKKSGIVGLLKDSQIERCLVAGKLGSAENMFGIAFSSANFSGLAWQCDAKSAIRNSALGVQQKPSTPSIEMSHRIVQAGYSDVSLENNIATDNTSSADDSSDPNGPNGRTVALASFNQYLFEHTLNWDFETVWEWDTEINLPTLRALTSSGGQGTTAGGNEVDLLVQQCQANIWL